jgi:hypothetical protein
MDLDKILSDLKASKGIEEPEFIVGPAGDRPHRKRCHCIQ